MEMLIHRQVDTTGDAIPNVHHNKSLHPLLLGTRNLFLLVFYYIIIIPIMLFVLSTTAEELKFDQPSEE
jgi:hypothetical protein